MPATRKTEVFLARKGKVFGPFDSEKFDQMHSSGELDQYTWIWDSRNGTWKAIDPAPSPLTFDNHKSEHPSLLALLVICFDRNSAISGSMESVTESGCDLFSTDRFQGTPFAHQGIVTLNILNPKSGHSQNTQARVVDSKHSERGWTFRMRWENRPSILSSS